MPLQRGLHRQLEQSGWRSAACLAAAGALATGSQCGFVPGRFVAGSGSHLEMGLGSSQGPFPLTRPPAASGPKAPSGSRIVRWAAHGLREDRSQARYPQATSSSSSSSKPSNGDSRRAERAQDVREESVHLAPELQEKGALNPVRAADMMESLALGVALGAAIASVRSVRKVCSMLRQRGVRLLSRVREGDLIEDKDDLPHMTTALHWKEALPLVKNYVLEHMGPASVLDRQCHLDMALFQVADAYSSAAHFGHWLRWSQKRYELEQLAFLLIEEEGASSSGCDKIEATESVPPRTMPAFLEYIANMDTSQKAQPSDSKSDAAAAIRRRVESVFKGSNAMQEEFLQRQCSSSSAASAGSCQEDWEAATMRALHEGMVAGQIPSVRLTVGGFRRLLLEGVAFGTLLGDSEVSSDRL